MRIFFKNKIKYSFLFIIFLEDVFFTRTWLFMFFVAQKILFTYLLNLEVLVPTTNIATTIRPSMLPIGAPRTAVGVPVRSNESTQPFPPTRLEVPLVGHPRWPQEFALFVCFAMSPLAFVHAAVYPQVLPRSMRRIPWQTPDVCSGTLRWWVYGLWFLLIWVFTLFKSGLVRRA